MSRSAVRIVEAGDSGLVLELGVGEPPNRQESVDAAVNARAIAIASTLRRRMIAGVRDVIPAFRSVTVFFDPLSTDVPAVTTALHDGVSQLTARLGILAAHTA